MGDEDAFEENSDKNIKINVMCKKILINKITKIKRKNNSTCKTRRFFKTIKFKILNRE